ncbi:hypothetical protein BV22DRAFT_824144 [Leucogyrophana mollusca]|uniref:Uncharacterized protein n=1 Tax=Leucogyrophana mollusca TaxID=85980 RepID=A0ACB8B3Y1_9AGAM|nr:hypothetical protein BV22DRAFT_824144 [Leucogyrophana mollusca]
MTGRATVHSWLEDASSRSRFYERRQQMRTCACASRPRISPHITHYRLFLMRRKAGRLAKHHRRVLSGFQIKVVSRRHVWSREIDYCYWWYYAWPLRRDAKRWLRAHHFSPQCECSTQPPNLSSSSLYHGRSVVNSTCDFMLGTWELGPR